MFIQTPYDIKKQLFAFLPDTFTVEAGKDYTFYHVDALWVKPAPRSSFSKKLNFVYGGVGARFADFEYTNLTYAEFLKEASKVEVEDDRGFISNSKDTYWGAEVIWNTETVWADARTPNLETKLRLLMDNYSNLPAFPSNADGWYRFSKSGK